MKILIRALALVFAALVLASCSSDADRIMAVLKLSDQAAQKAEKISSNPGDQANYIAAALQRIDASACPSDFRMAFQAHVLAWTQAVPYLANNTLGTSILEGFAAGLTEDSRLIGQANQQATYAAQQIFQTYGNVTLIAAKYGARIPTGARR